MKISFLLFLISCNYKFATIDRELATEVTPDVEIEIQKEVLRSHAKRLGINIGSPSTYESSQFLKNIVHNPGFEGTVFGSLIHVKDVLSNTQFSQSFWSTTWNQSNVGWPEHFWKTDGNQISEFEFVWGGANGHRGYVQDFTFDPINNVNIFTFDHSVPALSLEDVMIVRGELPPSISSSNPRPGSEGVQSLYLDITTGGVKKEIFDELGKNDITAGKLLRIKGRWKFEIWAKGIKDGQKMNINFQRLGIQTFISENISLTKEWKKIEIIFTAEEPLETKKHNYLLLTINENVPGIVRDSVYIDDIYLGPDDHQNPTPFRDELVQALKDLKPGILRNWSTQLGDTLDNQLATPYARKRHGFSPDRFKALHFGYSLHEFLQLSKELNQNFSLEPWYVIPPTFFPEEYMDLMEYLSGPADGNHPYADLRARLGQVIPWSEVFPKIHLEWGNETWGAADASDPFFGASAYGGGTWGSSWLRRPGDIANARFEILKNSPFYNREKFDLIVGGQYAFPDRQGVTEKYGDFHDSQGVAPYYDHAPNSIEFSDVNLTYSKLFSKIYSNVSTEGKLRQSSNILKISKRKLSIYEINTHTSGCQNCDNERLRGFNGGAGGAIALPLAMLLYLKELDITDQCAFTTSQFSIGYGSTSAKYTPLWGLLRDVAATQRKRPGWLGLELVNKSIFDKMLRTKTQYGEDLSVLNFKGAEYPQVESFAFQSDSARSLVLFNLNQNREMKVKIKDLISLSKKQIYVDLISSESLLDTNEYENKVKIKSFEVMNGDSDFIFTIPKHSLVSFRWNL